MPDDLRAARGARGPPRGERPARAAEQVTIKLFAPKPLGLTDTLRTLQNLGLTVIEELPLPLILPEDRTGFLYRLRIEAAPKRSSRRWREAPDRLLDALRALDEERATDDALNGLVRCEGLTWRQVEVLRTLRNHLCRSAPTTTRRRSTACCCATAPPRRRSSGCSPPASTRSPTATATRPSTRPTRALRMALEAVGSLVEDEVLRGVDNLMLGRRAHQLLPAPGAAGGLDQGGQPKVEGMPSPRPMFEIYVHSPQLEGIHLRGGKVARGGIRWSDRHDDFRTEVLGLMKTQMVKNSIIVPVGSKGGFVLKGNVPARPALDAYLIDRYREFVSGLLDVTDNIVDGAGPASARGGAPTTATTRTWWWPPTRARRTCPTPPTASPRSTASGWATRSPPAAASATTTRRWASPPAAPGSA